jgi:hypothetical protein
MIPDILVQFVNDIDRYKMECIMGFMSAFFFTIVLYGVYNKIIGEEMKKEIRKKIEIMDNQISIHHSYSEYYEKLLNYLTNDIRQMRNELYNSNKLVRKYKDIVEEMNYELYLSNELLKEQDGELKRYQQTMESFFQNIHEMQKIIDPIVLKNFIKMNSTNMVSHYNMLNSSEDINKIPKIVI